MTTTRGDPVAIATRDAAAGQHGNVKRIEITRVDTFEPHPHEFFGARDLHCLAITNPLKR